MQQAIHGDFFTYNDDMPLAHIEDQSVQMIFADIPYNMTDCEFDKNTWDLQLMWDIFHRILKPNGVVVMTATEPFNVDLINSNRKEFRYSWVWVKNQKSGFLNAKKIPLKRHELVLVFYKKLPIYNPNMTEGDPHTTVKRSGKTNVYNVNSGYSYQSSIRYPSSVQEFPCVSNTIGRKRLRHPTEKPLELLEYMIKTYTNEGDLVVDPCMGTGVTLLACKNLNRRCIGYEIDESYYNTAIVRLGD